MASHRQRTQFIHKILSSSVHYLIELASSTSPPFLKALIKLPNPKRTLPICDRKQCA